MFKTDCDFCDELSNGVDNTFVRTYQQTAKNRIIFRSRNFVVLPSLGQIVEGYLLIVPVSHYTAIADMPADIKLEISELCDRVRFAQTKTYGPSLFFEHGIRGKESGGCGVEHAHLHAVPFTSASEPIEELKKNHCLKMIDSISELSQ